MKLPKPCDLVEEVRDIGSSEEWIAEEAIAVAYTKIRDALREKESALDPYEDRHVIEALDDAIASIDEALNRDKIEMKGR